MVIILASILGFIFSQGLLLHVLQTEGGLGVATILLLQKQHMTWEKTSVPATAIFCLTISIKTDTHLGSFQMPQSGERLFHLSSGKFLVERIKFN